MPPKESLEYRRATPRTSLAGQDLLDPRSSAAAVAALGQIVSDEGPIVEVLAPAISPSGTPFPGSPSATGGGWRRSGAWRWRLRRSTYAMACSGLGSSRLLRSRA